MPTPNETMTASTDPALITRASRSRACPEEPITLHTAPLSSWREPQTESPQQQSPADSIGEEQSPAAEDTIKHIASSRDPKSESSPTVDQKTFSQRQLSYGSPVSAESPSSPSLSWEFSTKRLFQSSSSSFLRSGSRFVGKQTSDRSTYEVHVELKHVDISESFLCGYLRIQGLTEDHPTLTTYFEGEMIGDKYSFQTRRPEWGSSEKNDLQHWAKFQAYHPLAKKAKCPDFTYSSNFSQRENIFMRWKEYFLVPDHRVKQISGASFEGFYYICFNQIKGDVSGIYFHAKSERFQKLELNHVLDRSFGAIEFR